MQILLVEDSRDDAALLKDFLTEEDEAPDIHWVVDGHDALDYVFQQGRYAKAARPDVILLDLAMPRINGLETLKRLKCQQDSAGIPVIILTTSYSSMDRDNCIRSGADAFFSKPSNLQGYEELVRQLTRVEFPRLAQTVKNCN